jgi:hypothetical protein
MNTGKLNMNRNIFLKRSFSFACMILMAFAQIALIPFSGNARGKDSLGINPIIYVNGPLSTGPTSKSGVAAPAGFTWSELSTDNGGGNFSNTTLGAGCQQIDSSGTNNRCADNFIVPVGQTWTINSVLVYGYQTNSVANPFIGGSLQIWSGRPGDAGATVVFGNTTSNVMATPVDSTWFRIGNTLGGTGITPAATNTARKIWEIPLTVSPPKVLTAGNYWIDFQLNGGDGGNFTPLMSIPGARSLPGWNGRQFIGTTSTWGDLIDIGEPAVTTGTQPDIVPNVQLEYAFKLSGSIAGAPLIPRQRNMDFDGDNKSDYSIIRSATAVGQSTWITHASGGGPDTWTDFGSGVGFPTGDKAVPADYDGDGKTDVAVWRSSEGNWYILQSNGNVFRGESFGLAGDDPTVVGDYNGDTKDDMAVYRPGAGNTQSNFYYRTTANGGIFTVPFGLGNDIAVGGDFDGDGTADFHVARPGGGTYTHFEQRSTAGFNAYPWGLSTDKLVSADFDGDGRSDIAAVRTNGVKYDWYVLQSLTGSLLFQSWGTPATDYLTPGDYDGDGKADFAIWRSGQAANQTLFHVRGTASAYQTFEWGSSAGSLTGPDYPTANFAVK